MGIQVIKGGSISAYLKLSGDVALSASLISVVDQTNTVSGLQLATASIGLTMPTFLALPNWTVTLGIKDGFSSQQTVAVASLGTGVFRLIANKYTINNTAAQTGTVTGYFLNATETALNGITHNLMDLQVGGVSSILVQKNATILNNAQNAKVSFFGTADQLNISFTANATGFGLVSGGALNFYTNNNVRAQLTNTGLIIGTAAAPTVLFPMIKRNGAAIDFRLADDSAFCAINALTASFKTTNANANGTLAFINNSATTIASLTDSGSALTLLQFRADGINFTDLGTKGIVIQSSGYATNANASSILDIISTTKGFLPPRMTTAQVNAIATPAEGLVVFNTTISHLCVYQAAVWVKLSHSPM